MIYIQKRSHSPEKLLYFLNWPLPSVKSPTCPFIFTCCSVPLSGIKAELYPPAPPPTSPLPPPTKIKKIFSPALSKIYWPIHGIPSWQPALKFICNPSTIRNWSFVCFFSEDKKANNIHTPRCTLLHVPVNWKDCHVVVCFFPPPYYTYANLFLILMI